MKILRKIVKLEELKNDKKRAIQVYLKEAMADKQHASERKRS